MSLLGKQILGKSDFTGQDLGTLISIETVKVLVLEGIICHKIDKEVDISSPYSLKK